MQRVLRLGCLMLVVLGVCSRPAEANLWDWMEELSGPGPFRDPFPFSNFVLTLKCEGSGAFRLSTVDVKSPTTCFFLDQRVLNNDDKKNPEFGDPRFNKVNVSITEIGPSIRLHPAFELSAGMGAIHFSGSGTSETRLTISFPRLVFNPLLAVPKWQTNNNADLAFFKIYFRESIIVKGLHQSDFSPKPEQAKSSTPFATTNERVMSMGFIIDYVALGHLLNRIAR